MLVREAMTTPVITVPISSSVRQAIRVLHRHQITAAPVVDDAGRLVGIVSEMDLMRGEFSPDPRAFVRYMAPSDEPSPRRVAEVMTADVRTTAPGSDVSEVAEMMMATRIKSVPVLDGTTLVGILSRQDLMGVLARSDERILEEVREALATMPAGGGEFEVTVQDGEVLLRGDAEAGTLRLAETLARIVPGTGRVFVHAKSFEGSD